LYFQSQGQTKVFVVREAISKHRSFNCVVVAGYILDNYYSTRELMGIETYISFYAEIYKHYKWRFIVLRKDLDTQLIIWIGR